MYTTRIQTFLCIYSSIPVVCFYCLIQNTKAYIDLICNTVDLPNIMRMQGKYK